MPTTPLERTALQKRTFLVLFAFAAYLFWRTLEPIWVPVFLGLVIAVGMFPAQQNLLRKLGGKRPGLPAALLTGLVLSIAVGLVVFLVFIVGHRVMTLAQQISHRYQNRGPGGLIGKETLRFLSRYGVSEETLNEHISQSAQEVASFLGHGATSVVTGVFGAIFVFIFTALTSYYLLREGEEGTSWLIEIVPLPNGQVAELVRDVRDVTRAMIVSTGLVTLYQGVTAGIGYLIFGVDSPLVWASLTGLASILPAVGTALVWAPLSIIVMASGHVGQGLGVMAWSMVVVVFVADYLLRPRLVGTKMKMNDLLVFIAIFGGIEAFGILGLLLGPIAVAVLLSLVRIYQRDYRPGGPPISPDVTQPAKEREG